MAEGRAALGTDFSPPRAPGARMRRAMEISDAKPTGCDRRIRRLATSATDASAQNVLNLSGKYVCVQGCATGVAGQPAYITQNGWNMNILTEAGMASRAWIDWPGHIWLDRFQEGAVYSPDGMVIQFDRGTIWQRDLGLPPAPPPRRHPK